MEQEGRKKTFRFLNHKVYTMFRVWKYVAKKNWREKSINCTVIDM